LFFIFYKEISNFIDVLIHTTLPKSISGTDFHNKLREF